MASTNGQQNKSVSLQQHPQQQHQSWAGRKAKMRSPRSSGAEVAVKSSALKDHALHSHEATPVKPQSWTQSSTVPVSESPIAGVRTKLRDKLRPVSAAVVGKFKQRERKRTKRREPYMPSTEGTSTGEEEGEMFHMENVRIGNANDLTASAGHHRNSLRYGEHSTKAPPSSRRFSSPTPRRHSKSPSDLDADDEDNQDYDSASMISTSEILQTAAGASDLKNVPVVDDAVFHAQFQEIRMAGMQQLAEIDGSTGPPSVASFPGSASSSIEEQEIGKILEKERREKNALIQELGQKEQRIYEMEKVLKELNRRLVDSDLQNEHLRAENQTLLEAMAKLSAVE